MAKEKAREVPAGNIKEVAQAYAKKKQVMVRRQAAAASLRKKENIAGYGS